MIQKYHDWLSLSSAIDIVHVDDFKLFSGLQCKTFDGRLLGHYAFLIYSSFDQRFKGWFHECQIVKNSVKYLHSPRLVGFHHIPSVHTYPPHIPRAHISSTHIHSTHLEDWRDHYTMAHSRVAYRINYFDTHCI